MTGPVAATLAAVRRRLAAIRWGALAGWLAVAAVALAALGSWRPAIWPFMTYGAIYVDSPEVYTRERLVNDRYDQDHWLRNQLEALDVDPNLVARMIGRTLIADARGGGAAAAPGEPTAGAGAPGAAPGDPPLTLDFSDQFTIVSGVRDRIRQMILENMLDDRHDLLGNTMYGFKFDTTVLPGANTRSRAFVRVHASIERFFAPGDGAANVPGLSPHLSAALQKRGPDHERLEAYNLHYANWLENIEIRLNNFVAGYYALNAPPCPTDASWTPGSDIGKDIDDRLKRLLVQEAALRAARDAAELAAADLASMEGAAAEAASGGTDDAATATPAEADLALAQAQTAAAAAWVSVADRQRHVDRSRAAIDQLLLERDRPLVDEVTVRALQTVLAIPPDAILASIKESDPPLDPIELQINELNLRVPDPWRRFFEVARKQNMTACGPRPQFVVNKALDTLFMIEADADGGFPAWASREYYRVRTPEAMQKDVGEGRTWPNEFVAVSFDGVLNSLAEYASLMPSYNFPAAFVAEARARGETRVFCHDFQAEICPEGHMVEAITLNGGLFNLIEQLAKQDAYSYAIFPKSDAEGVLLQRRLEARAGAAGWLGLGGSTDERSADASSVLVGFGDSRIEDEGADAGKAIEFGWVITPPERGDAVQRTQMALISVPAWADEMSFEVTTGWLDAHSREAIDVATYPVRVPLPPDFEALDIVIWGGALDVQRRPIILDDFMDPPQGPMRLAACQAAQILIPGTRLWRSTAVTLGGQSATRIRVLPNMDGIIAEFDAVAAPASRPRGDGDQRILRVWTSEGAATSSKDIRVIVPDGAPLACPDVARRPVAPLAAAPLVAVPVDAAATR